MIRTSLFGVLVMVAACAAPVATNAPDPEAGPLLIQDEAQRLRAASCPDGVAFIGGDSIEISAEPVPLNPRDASLDFDPRVQFVGGWALTSDDARFGGLSGVEVFRNPNLIAVSDLGTFIWIPLDPVNAAPEGFGRMAELRDADGEMLEGKRLADSEGLALTDDGLALVSFERDHRVLAYDLEGCGANARGVPVARWSDRVTGVQGRIGENKGAEALAIEFDGRVLVALEGNQDNAPVANLPRSGGVDFSARAETPGLLSLVGADTTDRALFTVHRFYAPGIGNKIAVLETALDARGRYATPSQLIYLESPLTVDNFEAIAARQMDGKTRLFLVSDDNFSRRQRTLLFVFDVAD